MLYGPTSTPSASVASGEMIAVGWIFIRFPSSVFSFQGRNPPLQGGEGLPHLRQFREAGLHLQPLPMGHVGRAGDDLIRRDVFVDSGPGGDHDAVPDPDVADKPRLAADDDPFPQLRAARDADLGDDDGILADHHVVGDLDEVVDLDPPLDPGPAEGAAVDGRVRADLHIVVDLDVADLGDLPIFPSGHGKSEAVAADDDAGMEDDPPADQAAPVDGDAGIEDGGLADDGIPADEDPRVEHGPSLDARPAADVDAGIDHGLRRNVGPRFDGCIFADSRRLFILGMEKGKQSAQGDVGIPDDQEVFPRDRRFPGRRGWRSHPWFPSFSGISGWPRR